MAFLTILLSQWPPSSVPGLLLGGETALKRHRSRPHSSSQGRGKGRGPQFLSLRRFLEPTEQFHHRFISWHSATGLPLPTKAAGKP